MKLATGFLFLIATRGDTTRRIITLVPVSGVQSVECRVAERGVADQPGEQSTDLYTKRSYIYSII